MQRPITPLAFALSCFTAVLTPTALDLGTCDAQVERMRHTFDAIETFDALHVQDESWPLPVSPHGTSMFGADNGYLVYGPSHERDWPELAEILADIDTDQRMWERWGDLADQRAIEATHDASTASPSAVLLHPNSVTVGLLVQHLATTNPPVFHVGEPTPEPPPAPPRKRRHAR